MKQTLITLSLMVHICFAAKASHQNSAEVATPCSTVYVSDQAFFSVALKSESLDFADSIHSLHLDRKGMHGTVIAEIATLQADKILIQIELEQQCITGIVVEK